MSRYVAFLRGLNLGGRRITNEALRSHFEALGCEDVATFRASGNVVFAKSGRPVELTAQLEEGLGEALGYEVPVFLRSAKQLLAIAAQEPFDARQLAASKGSPRSLSWSRSRPRQRQSAHLRWAAAPISSHSTGASFTGFPKAVSPNPILTTRPSPRPWGR